MEKDDWSCRRHFLAIGSDVKKKRKQRSKISNALFIELSMYPKRGRLFLFKKENYLGTPYVHARNEVLFL